MSSIYISGGTISFSDREVREVNYKSSIPFVWIILDDGTQINIPINTAQTIASKLPKTGDIIVMPPV